MSARVVLLTAALASSVCSVGQAFMTSQITRVRSGVFTPRAVAASSTSRRAAAPGVASQRRFEQRMSTSTDVKELGLTPELERLTKVFRSCPTDKMRQMQLMHLGQMGEAMEPALMTEENKVLG